MKRNLGSFTDTDTLTWLILIGDLNLLISALSKARLGHVNELKLRKIKNNRGASSATLIL